MDNNYLVCVYAMYAACALALTVWLARTLYSNGAVFLEEVFDRKEIASRGQPPARHRLLHDQPRLRDVLVRRTTRPRPQRRRSRILVQKLGILLLTLAAVHFVNVYVFWRCVAATKFGTCPRPCAAAAARRTGSVRCDERTDAAATRRALRRGVRAVPSVPAVAGDPADACCRSSSSPPGRRRRGTGSARCPWLGADLVVVDEARATCGPGPPRSSCACGRRRDYRVWSYRLSGRAFAPLAEWFFHVVSSNRGKIGAVVGRDATAPTAGASTAGSRRRCRGSRDRRATYQPPVTGCSHVRRRGSTPPPRAAGPAAIAR